MDGRCLIPLGNSRVKPALQNPQLIALLELLNRLLHRAEASDVIEQLLHVGLLALQVDEGPEHAGRGVVVHLEDVDLDVLVEVVLVEVPRQLVHVAVHIAKEDQRPWVLEALLLQEVLHVLRVVVFRLLGDHPLELLHLIALGRRLDVLMVGGSLGGGIDQRAEEEVDALEGAHAFEDLDADRDGQPLVVRHGHVHHDLEVLPRVPKEVLHAGESRLGLGLSEVIHHPLRVEPVGIEDDSLDVLDVVVILEGPLVEPLLLAKLGDPIAVELVPGVHLKDGVRNLGRGDEVHLEHLGLPRPVLWAIEPHALDEEGRHLLEPVELQEKFCDPVDIDVGVPLEESFSEIECAFWGGHHDISKHGHVISLDTVLGLNLHG